MFIDFMKISKKMIVLSLTLLFLSGIIIFNYKIDFGLEFIGGVEVELHYTEKVKIADVKKQLSVLGDIQVKYYGSNKNIQLKIKNNKRKDELIVEVEKVIGNDAKMLRLDYMGPEMTGSIIKNSCYSILAGIFCMVIYLIFRFNYILAFNALVALVHDIIILLGIISLLGIEFNLAVFSALFAVFGYSINDTIVIFDRLRENIKINKDQNMYNLINMSVNSTLLRTLNTSISTLMVTLIILIFGGTYLFGFALVLSLGVIIGTYSSIYLSTYLMLFKD
ncbi:MAG: protein translocase subunit SecF [Candidatus Riesia sp.]|nr:protein translocase subunit SecF [Candidatus Riesia sp.]